MRKDLKESQAQWREAVSRRDEATNGHSTELDAEVVQSRESFQHLSNLHMIDRIDALKEAESRRSTAVPSTPPFHQAAKDEVAIASEIWHSAKEIDVDSPKTDQRDTSA